jgi:hypothetical protein
MQADQRNVEQSFGDWYSVSYLGDGIYRIWESKIKSY